MKAASRNRLEWGGGLERQIDADAGRCWGSLKKTRIMSVIRFYTTQHMLSDYGSSKSLNVKIG